MAFDAEKVLGASGMVASKLAGYEVRAPQLAMADAVAQAFEKSEHLLVEAGTGVGKSFAYLIPAIEHVTQQGGRVVISTHTIALQEQIIDKDVPFLSTVLPWSFRAVLVKGRGNYVCKRRLERAGQRRDMLFDTHGQEDELWRIKEWAAQTEDGSLADLEPQPDRLVWERVKSDPDECIGNACKMSASCFYRRARQQAQNAHLLVVNHAMLFTDVAVKNRGASLLPRYDLVVLDEAHTIEQVAGNHLGLALANTQVSFLLNGLFNERTGKGLLAKHGDAAQAAVQSASREAENFFADLAEWYGNQAGWNGRLREPSPIDMVLPDALLDLGKELDAIRRGLDNEEDQAEFEAATARCAQTAEAVTLWDQQDREGWVYWLEVSPSARRRVNLAARPIDIAGELRSQLWDKLASAVLTSATLTTGGADAFGYMRTRLGLEDSTSVALGSPYNYREQMIVYVEAGMPEPAQHAAFVPAVCQAIEKYLTMSEGRAFVLFTSYRMLQDCAAALTPFLLHEQMPLLAQGAGMPRSRMLEEFRRTPRSVLFGTDSFWAGVDVPGEALSNVIIVRLPFSVPDHPMTEARMEQIRAAGGNPFMSLQVPEAVLKFRQGIGRLIRSHQDRGMIVILDPRVVTKRYGHTFLDALPDCEIVINR